VLGCLVCANYGTRRDLHLLVGPVEHDADAVEPPPAGGSIVIVLGTDAPLSERQLRRVAARATFGLGRAGGFGTNASGEYALAFSTAHRIAHREDTDHLDLRLLRDDSNAVRELFEATVEVVHEAVLNSLCAAEPAEGRDGNRIEALPYGLLEGAPGLRPHG